MLPASPFFLLTETPKWVNLAMAAFRLGAGGVVSSSPRSITSAASFLGLTGVVSFVSRISVGSFSVLHSLQMRVALTSVSCLLKLNVNK